MKNTGFVFPGQGSQKQGMLSELAQHFPVVEETFAQASAMLGLDLWEVCQADESNLLNETHITQPALLAASVSIWRIWQAEGSLKPAFLAGHSLGEYSALVCGGVIKFTDAAKLVHQRGLYMQSAVKQGEGKMAAIVGLEDSKIVAACAQAAQGQIVSAANFNALGQTVISGESAAVERAIEACKEAGAKRALPLNVSVPSHCGLMKAAAEKLAADLESIEFKSPEIPILQNVDAQASFNTDEIKDKLARQLYEPVQWVETILALHVAGITRVIECGPGRVLAGLIKRTEPAIDCFASDSPESYAATRKSLQ